ncbi:hypothetical protein ACFQY7_02080 [Actinomadura luteofluorescens]|uniref:DUF3995 domain-containing protein n=1 Tax=Actinomadura luteofluorescens TaxID=46163 RepID=A0A7Y9ECK2_9ACTN|nr:hypothetical protein [Actinomadura luteofluorescens]NYD45239.1 hypothetical protein [Actinomadura luteofluorescens]
MLRNPTAMIRRMHGDTVEDAPRWAVVSAYAASLVVLPSCLWRIALGFGAPIGPLRGDMGDARGDLPGWVPMWGYTIFLSVLSEALAFLAVGLVARWGEVVPRWIPGLAGRRVPVLAAAVPAGTGAAVLTIVTITSLPGFNEFTEPDGTAVALEGWRLALFVASYGPLVLWGPLLAAATAAYCLRRTRRPSPTALSTP